MGKQILVIADEATILKAFALALADAPYAVITTPSLDAALRFFDEKTIDLVFLDILLPNAEGIEVLKKIKTKNPFVPVCIISDHPEDFDEKLDFLDNKALTTIKFLQKPVSINQIEHVVLEQLE